MEAVGKGADAIERLSNYTFALHILPAFLAADICLLHAFGTNVLTTKWSELSKDALGFGICAVVGYVVAMAVAVPVIHWVVDRILLQFRTWINALSDTLATALSHDGDHRPFVPREIRVKGSRVRSDVVRERALRDRDDFWLQLVQEHETKAASSERTEKALAKLSFATVAFALVDVVYLSGGSILDTAVQKIAAVLGAQSPGAGYLVVAAAVCAVALPWIGDTFFERDSTLWIEHPALADELMTAFSKRQAELRDAMIRPARRR